MACRTHTPAIVTATLCRTAHLRPPTEFERRINRTTVMSNHDVLLLSDLVWLTERRDGEFFAHLMKSRTVSMDRASEVKIMPNPEYRV